MSNATLLAYAEETSGWAIAYGLSDGLLYISETPNNSSQNLTPMTWDLPSITGENWIVNATFANGTAAGSLYIDSNRSNAVGIIDSTGPVDINGTFNGFGLFATQLVYNNDSYLQAQFWAEATDVSGLYAVVWIEEDGEATNGSFPLVIKAVDR